MSAKSLDLKNREVLLGLATLLKRHPGVLKPEMIPILIAKDIESLSDEERVARVNAVYPNHPHYDAHRYMQSLLR